MKHLAILLLVIPVLLLFAGCTKVDDDENIVMINNDFTLVGSLKEFSNDTALVGWKIVLVDRTQRQAGRVSYPAFRLLSSGVVNQSGDFKMEVSSYDQSVRDGWINGQGTQEERKSFYANARILLVRPDEYVPINGFHEKKYIVPDSNLFALPNLRQITYSGDSEEVEFNLKINSGITMYKFLLDDNNEVFRSLTFRELSTNRSFQNYTSLPFPYNSQEDKWTVHHALPSREEVEATIIFKAQREEDTKIIKDTFFVGGPEEFMVKEYFY